MYAVKTLRQRLGDLLKADTTTLNQAVNALEVHLVTTPFTPSDLLTLADFTDATFTGATALTLPTGPQVSGMDPVSGAQNVIVQAPIGGFVWTCTAAPTPAQVVTGVILTTNARAALLGMQPLDQAVTIANIGDTIIVPEILFNIPFATMHL